MSRTLLVCACALLASCTKEQQAAPAPVVAPVDAGPQTSARLALTPEKLTRFVDYRAKLRAAYAQNPRTGTQPPQNAGEVQKAALAFFEARTLLRVESAEAAGLKHTEAMLIESMVFEVMAHRSLAKNGEYGKTLAQLRESLDRMHPDQRVDALKDVEELEAMLKRMSTGEALRGTLGDANVDLILSRAEELLPIYEQALIDERTQQ